MLQLGKLSERGGMKENGPSAASFPSTSECNLSKRVSPQVKRCQERALRLLARSRKGATRNSVPVAKN